MRIETVTAWLNDSNVDILLLQELKGVDFPADLFINMGYESAVVSQKAYNGVAILSRSPIQILSTTLNGDAGDESARFLEVCTHGIRVVDVYCPNGNPVGTEKFAFKLAWMERLKEAMRQWRNDSLPTLIGGDFNIIPEDIDCHKPASWMRDALFQPEPRACYRELLELGYTDAFRSLHPGEGGHFTFWDYFRQAFEHNRGIRIDHFLLCPRLAARLQSCHIDTAPRRLQKPSDHAPILIELMD
jgi:exodeoxyribonuclease-3